MIGIFDSGIGGLTTVRALMDFLPGYDLTYFGDIARYPYGSKSHETVIRYAMQNTDFLLKCGAKVIVMACNTASSVATRALREKYDVPVFEVISPAVDLSIKKSPRSAIGIIGTRGTINSGIYETKIKEKLPEARVYSAACPLLVPLVEEGWLNRPETTMIVKKYLHPIKTRQVDTLILGCTHYPLLKSAIQHKMGNRVKIIDSSIAVVKEIKKYLVENPEREKGLGKNSKSDFYVSDITDQFEKTARAILQKKVTLEKITHW